jgi:SNF family Na+-dependent transporter
MSKQNEEWSSRIGVILAVTGSAVGLGNFLRFPGQAAKYGGGAFMIPYLCAFLLLGLPIAWVEWAIGRYGGRHGYNSLPGIFRVLWARKLAPYLGVLGVIIPVVIYMYYVYIEAWCLGYAIRYLTGQMALGSDPKAYDQFFSNYVGAGADGSAHISAVVMLVVCFVINFLLLYRGLSKGIELFCRWAMPALFVCAFLVLLRVLTLDAPPGHPEQSLLNGLGYMWNPSTPEHSLFDSLANSEVWLAAAGQIFFSLSVGFGIIITYASYLKKDDDIALSAVTACAGNGFAEVALGGMITIPAAFVFLGEDFVKNPPGTFGMGFSALPSVFNQMVGGQVFGFLFFFLLFLAAVTSSLSMLQPAIALLEEGIGVGRRVSVTLLGLVTALGAGFVVYFSKDFKALDTLDFWVGSVFIYVLATIQVFLFAWVFGMDKGMGELSRGAEIRIPKFVRYIIQFVAPTYLLAIFGVWIYEQFIKTDGGRLAAIQHDPVVQYSMGLLGIMVALFLVLIAQSVQRWRRLEGKGERP